LLAAEQRFDRAAEARHRRHGGALRHIGVLAAIPNKRQLMVPSQEGDTLSIVNLDRHLIEATIPLRKGGVPWHARVTPDGKFALVTNTEFTGHVDTCPNTDSTVSVVDLQQRRMVREITVGAGPVMLEMDAKRNRAYVTNRVSNTLSVIDLETMQVLTTIAVGSAPFWVGLTQKQDLLIVGNFEDATLTLIDPDTFEVKNTVLVGTPQLEDPDPEYGKGDTMGFAIGRDGGRSHRELAQQPGRLARRVSSGEGGASRDPRHAKHPQATVRHRATRRLGSDDRRQLRSAK
jgi:YVTN family beta-propeller protein